MKNVRADGADGEKADWIRRVLGVEIPRTADGGPPPESHEEVGARLESAMQALTDRIQQAIQSAPHRRDKLTAAVAAFADALKNHDTNLAERLLKSITAEVDHVIAAVLQAHAGTVAYDQLLTDWNNARDAVAADLRKLEQAVLKDFEGDPRYDRMKVNIRKLDQILATFGDDLRVEIDRAMDAQPPERPAIHQAAQKVITGYKAYVTTDTFFARIDTNPYIPLGMRARLSGALDDLNEALGG